MGAQLKLAFPGLHFHVEQNDSGVYFRCTRGMCAVCITVTDTGHVMTTATSVTHEESGQHDLRDAFSMIRVTI